MSLNNPPWAPQPAQWFAATSTQTAQQLFATTFVATNPQATSTQFVVGKNPAYGQVQVSVNVSSTVGVLSLLRDHGEYDVPAKALTFKLPDGTRLVVDDKGGFRVDDKDAKVVYRANRVREFSPYLNASDMLERFVKYVSTVGVRRREDVLGLPIELFLHWLVLEAAKADDDPPPGGVFPIPAHPRFRRVARPRCGWCQRFIRRAAAGVGFNYCDPGHAFRFWQARGLGAPRLACA